MEKKIKGKVSREDLYKYCSEIGLMLSWGVPLTKILKEMEVNFNNPVLNKISFLLSDGLIMGASFADVLGRFPYVFKPVFFKWVKIGEKFGLLDDVLLKMAGLYRFDYLICGKNSLLSQEELGKFLQKFSLLLYEEKLDDSELLSAIRSFTKDPIINSWIENISKNFYDRKFFGNSLRNYLTYPIYRKIANPLFWQVLEIAESGGYLPSMLEILGLYLIDENNLLPSSEGVDIDCESLIDRQSPFSIAGEILEIIEKSKNKKARITICNDSVRIIIDEIEEDLIKVSSLRSYNSELLIAVINSLKISFDLDAVEKRLIQKGEIEYTIEDRKYRVLINIIPPYPLLEGEKVFEAICREMNQVSKEIIEITFKRV